MRVWNKGAPPHVGWWNASAVRNEKSWRWWNGRRWSRAVGPKERARIAGAAGVEVSSVWRDDQIEWTTYYPENARVPRLDPADGWVFNAANALPSHCAAPVFKRQAGFESWLSWDPTGGFVFVYAWRPAKG